MTSSGLPTCYRHPDRETGLSCSECGRPICTECMTPAAVGIRCPDHAGKARTIRAPRVVARPAGDAIVTKILIGLNIAIYLITAVQGNGLNQPGGKLFNDWALFGPLVAQGDWWRLVTSMFLHGFILHIVFNLVALWYIGRPVEQYLGSLRFLLLYFVSGLAGSAGALVSTPHGVTVGASGAIFGVLGAMLILEWNATGKFGGAAASMIAINLVFNFAYNGAGGNISVGGHIGGLIGGILVTLAYANFGRGHASYGKIGPRSLIGVIAVAAASIVVAYLQVH
jgi:membrane associated rhomboid family serine protease